jgi:hypothetical protein
MKRQHFCHICGELLPAKNKRLHGLCRECYEEEKLNELCEKRISEEKDYEEFLDNYYDDRIEQRLIGPIKEYFCADCGKRLTRNEYIAYRRHVCEACYDKMIDFLSQCNDWKSALEIDDDDFENRCLKGSDKEYYKKITGK